MTTFVEELKRINACKEARGWVADRTLAEAWEECPRADWMLWLAARKGVGQRKLVGAAASVARDVLHIFERIRPGDVRVRDCLDACDRYAAGENINLSTYRYAAAAAANAAAAAAAASAVNAAYAAYAAYAAANNAAARTRAQARHADIVRKHITTEDFT